MVGKRSCWLMRSGVFPSSLITGPAEQSLSTYIARDPEAQSQLRSQQIYAEDENSKGPSKHDVVVHYGGYGKRGPKKSAGTWVESGVSAGVSPLASKPISRACQIASDATDQTLILYLHGKKIWLSQIRAHKDSSSMWRFRLVSCCTRHLLIAQDMVLESSPCQRLFDRRPRAPPRKDRYRVARLHS
jgi:hypothetical protein